MGPLQIHMDPDFAPTEPFHSLQRALRSPQNVPIAKKEGEKVTSVFPWETGNSFFALQSLFVLSLRLQIY